MGAFVQLTGSSASEIVFENDEYRVFYRRGRQDFLWVTFCYFGHPTDHYWGQPIADAYDYSILSFHDKGNSWFAGLEKILGSLEYIFMQYPVRIGMGVSMGGYAAIKYSKAIGFLATLAVAPQYSIDPSVIDDFRYKDWFSTYCHKDMGIQRRDVHGTIYILSDPHFTPDEAHRSLIVREVNMIHIRTHYTGHLAVIAIAGSRRMEAVISALLGRDTAALRSLVHNGRRKAIDRPTGLLCAGWAQHNRVARAMLDAYRNLMNPGLLQASLFDLSRVLERHGDCTSALSAMTAAVSIMPNEYLAGRLAAMSEAYFDQTPLVEDAAA
jgi:hypothetical protein